MAQSRDVKADIEWKQALSNQLIVVTCVTLRLVACPFY